MKKRLSYIISAILVMSLTISQVGLASAETGLSLNNAESTLSAETSEAVSGTDTAEGESAENSEGDSENTENSGNQKDDSENNSVKPSEDGNQSSTDKPSKEETKPEAKPEDKTEDKGLADGTYKVLSDTDNRMFYMVADSKGDKYSQLTVKNGEMHATFTLTGSGYDYLYMGSPEKAAKADSSKWIKASVKDGLYSFTIPVSKLDEKFSLAAHGTRSGSWYEHTVIFYSSRKAKDRIEKGGNTETKPSSDDKNSGSKDNGSTSGDKNTSSKGDKDSSSGDKNTSSKDDKDSSSSSKNDKPAKEEPAKGENKPTSGNKAVDSSTSLPDGTYQVDSFKWSGGSGRLAYIRCNKVTVKNGQAWATIEYSSSSYDKVMAGGKTYGKEGSGNSVFTIPVKMNANNGISGRTVAMSAPHWVDYTIYPYIKGAEAKQEDSRDDSKDQDKDDKNDDKKDNQDKADSVEAEEHMIIGLEYISEVEVTDAEYFRIYNYSDGIRLLEVNIGTDSAVQYDESEAKEPDEIEYDEDGKPIAKSQGEITRELYRNNTLKYLIVPEGVEIPAGCDKEMIIVKQGTDKAWTGSEAAMLLSGKLEKADSFAINETEWNAPDFKEIVQKQIELAVLPSAAVSGEIDGVQDMLETLETRFSTLGVPVIVDRSCDEKTEKGRAEWLKVYAALLGTEMPDTEMLSALEKDSAWAAASEADRIIPAAEEDEEVTIPESDENTDTAEQSEAAENEAPADTVSESNAPLRVLIAAAVIAVIAAACAFIRKKKK